MIVGENMSCIAFEKYKDLNKIFEEKEHQKKVIDRLSRKIQKLKRQVKHYRFSYLIANNHLTRNYITKRENDFLRKRENKLQLIEQMFKSGSVDLEELRKNVMEDGDSNE